MKERIHKIETKGLIQFIPKYMAVEDFLTQEGIKVKRWVPLVKILGVSKRKGLQFTSTENELITNISEN